MKWLLAEQDWVGYVALVVLAWVLFRWMAGA